VSAALLAERGSAPVGPRFARDLPRVPVSVSQPQPLRIGLIASPTQTVEQPFTGGMEAHTVALAESMVALDEQGYDIVHNNCLHYLPVAMAGSPHACG
jgi:hypothetical protein